MRFRRRRAPIIAGTIIAGIIGLLAPTANAAPPLEDARWAREGSDIVRLLTTSPGECLAPPASPDENWRVEVGRAAFRTPLLFGGTAARAGLSCNSCHRDGRDNPEFFLDGLSGAPGTADVTSSIFSKTREDGVFNPVAIPTLVDVVAKSSFGTVAPHGSIEDFVQSAVDEEFGGEPPPGVVAAVAAYISQLDSRHCPSKPLKASFGLAMHDARRTLFAAHEALRRNDADTADFLFAAAREVLGRVHRRFSLAGLESEQAALAALSSKIATLRAAAKADIEQGHAGMPKLRDEFEETFDALYKAREESLYERAVLERWLEEVE